MKIHVLKLKLRKLHKYIGFTFSLFILHLTITGVLLTYPETFEIEEALKVLSLDSSNPDHLCKYEENGTAGDEATIELRNLFGLASYREELFPDSKPDVVTPDDVDMALWLAMLGITYLVMLDLVMQDCGGCH